MEKFIVATEKSWWIILVIMAVLFLFGAVAEVLRRTKFKENYIKFLSLVYTIGCGGFSLVWSLIFIWWLALPVCIGWLFFTRMEEKADILKYFRNKSETVEDYKPYQSNLLAMCSSAFLSYMVGVIVQFYFDL